MLARKRLSKGLTLSFVYVAVLTALLGLAGCASTHVASGDSPTPGKITVTTSSLPTGQTGNTYTSTLQAQGGTPPYKWSLTSGTLPAGLSLNSATGVISGTPTQSVANLSLSFTVTDSSATPLSASFTLSLTVTAASSGITITTQSLPNGQINVAYSATLAATGGTAPYTWTLSGGTLPAGLTLNGATGAITGTPTAPASAVMLTFKVMDSSSPALTQTATLTMTIFPAGLVITTTSLPNGQVNAAYSAALTAIGGASPYTWSLTSGTLPAGLTLIASTGAIIGTPTIAVTATPLTFKVTDASSPALTQTANLALTISPAGLVITTTSLPNGQINTAYSATLAVSGGTGPYTWLQTGGTLPAGLTLNGASGTINGKPTAAVTNAPLTFKVTDSSVPALTQSANLTITISASPLVITTSSLPNGQQGTAYTATLAAVGGVTPYAWTVTSGTLPTGLTLNSVTGALTGTPTVAVTNLALTFKVTDSSTPALTQSANLTLTIAPAPLVITTTSLPNGQVGTAYSSSLATTGGTAPYTWTVFSGTLPAGLTLNAGTGAITGTPTASVNAVSLTFKVTDSSTVKQSQNVTLTLTIAPAPLVITTTSLPNAEITMPYNATLAATGGTTPYTWKLTGGTLPTGLALNAATGAITGTPTTPVTNTPLTFMVTDSAVPALTKSANLTLTITGLGTFTVSVSPLRAALTTTQPLNITATTNDPAGVTWTATGGSFSSPTTATGVPVKYTAPGTAGTYTVTATSVSDGSDSASTTIYVTDLAGVYTYHNDLARDGVNAQEYALSTSTVKTSFGKLFSCQVDGAIYAQPLWVANLTLGGVNHNVVLVATQHDSLYAFDADVNTSPCTPLWHVSLIDAAHGGSSSETPVPSGTTGNLVGGGSGDITPEVGVTGTPVIDSTSHTLYVVSKSVITSGPTFYQRIHAIDITSGSEKFGGPANITSSNVTFPGTGDGGTTDSFNARSQNQRPGLALVGGVVYVAWASHEDNNNPPYYGWVVGFNASNLAVASILNVAPNAQRGGIWMGGAAPSADSSNNLYLITGNANFDATNTTAPNNDYGDSFLKLTSSLAVSQYFTPSDESNDNAGDNDFGAGGAAILVDQPTGPVQHLVIGGGKDGYLYLLNRDAMGGFGDSNAWQRFNFGNGIFATGAFWNNTFYLAGIYGPLQAYTFNTTTGKFNTANVSQSSATFSFPGSTPSVSSSGTTNGIVWALNNGNYCTKQSQGCGPAVLHAYDATSLATELWNSSTSGTDNAGNAVKFSVPTVANGKVYVGTRGSDNSQGGIGELDVYGLKPN
jgi:hypothetical protein